MDALLTAEGCSSITARRPPWLQIQPLLEPTLFKIGFTGQRAVILVQELVALPVTGAGST